MNCDGSYDMIDMYLPLRPYRARCKLTRADDCYSMTINQKFQLFYTDDRMWPAHRYIEIFPKQGVINGP